jgi:hypothetical protein
MAVDADGRLTIYLRHEALTFARDEGSSFGRASLESRRVLEQIDGPSEVVYVEYAATHEEAMQLHYDRQGWGRYKPIPGVTDLPYERKDLEQQLIDYPEDAELRARNGL